MSHHNYNYNNPARSSRPSHSSGDSHLDSHSGPENYYPTTQQRSTPGSLYEQTYYPPAQQQAGYAQASYHSYQQPADARYLSGQTYSSYNRAPSSSSPDPLPLRPLSVPRDDRGQSSQYYQPPHADLQMPTATSYMRSPHAMYSPATTLRRSTRTGSTNTSPTRLPTRRIPIEALFHQEGIPLPAENGAMQGLIQDAHRLPLPYDDAAHNQLHPDYPVAPHVYMQQDGRVAQGVPAHPQAVAPEVQENYDHIFGYAPAGPAVGPQYFPGHEVLRHQTPPPNASPADGLRNLAGRYTNSPGMRVNMLRIEPGHAGHFEVWIVLGMADIL